MSADMNVPEIRFKGFSGEWVPKTLGSSVSYIKGFAFKSNDYEDNGTRIVRVSDLTKNSLSESSSKIYISSSKANLYSNYIIDGGDIVITTVGSKAEMRESAVGRAIIFTKNEGHLLNQNLVKVTPAIANDSQFIYNQLLREQYAKFIEDIQRGNANQANIAIGDLWEYSLNFPKVKKEQAQIGNTFQKLDNLINQHQQKHDKLSSIKKAMLEKMFPKQGETTPEIRFKGFSGEWEEKELADVANMIMGQSPSGENYTDNPNDFILVQGNADLKNGFVVPRVWTSEATKVATKGALIFSVRAPVGEVGKTNYDVVLGRGVAAIYGNEFIYQQLRRLQSDNYWYKVSAGSTFDAISSAELASTFIWVSSESEQDKIGNYFQKLDTLINQHQQQITKLNNIKQACLSKMFV
jgi:type I restriction enzyme S subunit